MKLIFHDNEGQEIFEDGGMLCVQDAVRVLLFHKVIQYA